MCVYCGVGGLCGVLSYRITISEMIDGDGYL